MVMCVCVCVCVCARTCSHVCQCCVLSCLCLFVTPCTAAFQAPLSLRFSRQEYWSGLSCPSPGDLPDPRVELASLMSPVLTGGFITNATWEALRNGDTPIEIENLNQEVGN